MDSAEKMAADIAVKLNGGEWSDGKWYSEGHRKAWIEAVKPYADEIERLRETVSMLAGDRDLYIEEIKRKNAEIERLREDLWKIMMAYPEESYAHVIAKSALQQKDTK